MIEKLTPAHISDRLADMILLSPLSQGVQFIKSSKACMDHPGGSESFETKMIGIFRAVFMLSLIRVTFCLSHDLCAQLLTVCMINSQGLYLNADVRTCLTYIMVNFDSFKFLVNY